MRTRYGSSPWITEFPASRRPGFPRFRNDRAANVVIVGAGLVVTCGATLLHLASGDVVRQPDHDAVFQEAGKKASSHVAGRQAEHLAETKAAMAGDELAEERLEVGTKLNRHG